jgi:hypothetical protein
MTIEVREGFDWKQLIEEIESSVNNFRKLNKVEL